MVHTHILIPSFIQQLLISGLGLPRPHRLPPLGDPLVFEVGNFQVSPRVSYKMKGLEGGGGPASEFSKPSGILMHTPSRSENLERIFEAELVLGCCPLGNPISPTVSQAAGNKPHPQSHGVLAASNQPQATLSAVRNLGFWPAHPGQVICS